MINCWWNFNRPISSLFPNQLNDHSILQSKTIVKCLQCENHFVWLYENKK